MFWCRDCCFGTQTFSWPQSVNILRRLRFFFFVWGGPGLPRGGSLVIFTRNDVFTYSWESKIVLFFLLSRIPSPSRKNLWFLLAATSNSVQVSTFCSRGVQVWQNWRGFWKLGALTIWMEFSVVFSGQMELHFFPLRKRNRLNRIIWSEFSDASGPGSGYISTSTRNMVAELPVVLDVLSNDLENYFFGEEGDNFICLAAAASTFCQGNQQSASTLFSLNAARAEARWKLTCVFLLLLWFADHKICFHLQGCSCACYEKLLRDSIIRVYANLVQKLREYLISLCHDD